MFTIVITELLRGLVHRDGDHGWQGGVAGCASGGGSGSCSAMEAGEPREMKYLLA